MCSKLSQSDLQTILEEANAAARCLSRRMLLPPGDLADIRQELLADLIARLPAFDRARGTIGVFAGMVMANRATRIARTVNRERRLFGAVPMSLNEIVPNSDGACRGDLVAEEDGFAAFLGQSVDAFGESDRRIDVERGLGTLDANDKSLCAALSRNTVDRLVDAGHGARSSLYRRINEIRLVLTAAGLRAAV